MAILPRMGRAAIAMSLKSQTVHVAWGTGLPEWDALLPAVAPEDPDATGLVAEVGRRVASLVAYLQPDAAGPNEVDDVGKLSISEEPTNLLFVRAVMDFSFAADQIIREIGVFLGTEVVEGLPSGQVYFSPGEIADPGMLLQLEHRPPLYRSPGTRETIEILIVI